MEQGYTRRMKMGGGDERQEENNTAASKIHRE
jgi:hypothetical protein